jgi:hypothetical protein
MSNTSPNQINLLLKVDSSGYQYLYCLDNGVLVDFKGLKVSASTIINIELTSDSNETYIIDACIITPSNQNTVTAKITGKKTKKVVITDTDGEEGAENYYFAVTVLNRNTQVPTICDPQVRNRGKL